MFRASLGWPLLFCIAGCGRGPDGVVPVTLTTDGTTLTVGADPFSLELKRGDAVVARTASPGLEIGTLTPYDPKFYPDPTNPQNGVVYAAVTVVTSETTDGNGYQITAATSDPSRTVSLHVAPEPEAGFTFSATPIPADGVVHLRLSFEAGASEQFFGLGEYFDTFAQRGKTRDVRFALDTTIESGYNEAHIPVPSYVSTTGFGLLLDNREPLVVDFASADAAEHLTLVAGALAAHFVAGADPVAAEARMQQIVGLPPLWPPWMFAPFQWRDDDPVTCTAPCNQGCMPSSTGADLVLDDATQMRAHKLPGSVIWIDAPWMTAFDDFNFNPTQFPDAAGMIATLHAKGYQVMVWSAPFVDSADDTATECGILPPPAGGLFTEMAAKNYFVKQSNGQPLLFPWRGSLGALCDFTNPDAFAFWKTLVKRTTDLGIIGYKMDWDEYVVAALGTSRPDFKFSDGTTGATEHALMHELWHKAHQEALMEAGAPGFELVRSGDAADAKYASAVWPGDLDNDFSTHRQVGQDGVQLVGGLPSAVNAAVSLAASLHPHFGSDIGGLRHGLPNKEVMARWSEFAALTTVMELGGGGVSHNVWDFTISDFDQSLLDIYATYARLHMSLFPYLYSYVKRNSSDGTPILRAPAMMFPGDAALAAATFEYFFGEDLLVAPVVVDQARSRMVTFPAGSWINWWTREVVVGPATAMVDAPIDRLPLFARAGAIVPLLAPDVDTLTSATDPTVVTAEMRASQMPIKLFPAASRTFTLADGTTLTSAAAAGSFTFTVAAAAMQRTLSLEVLWPLVSSGPPSQISKSSGTVVPLLGSQAALDAAMEGAYYDATTGLLRIKISATDETLTVK